MCADHSSDGLIGIVLLVLLQTAPLEAVDDVVAETVNVDRVFACSGVIAEFAPVEWSYAVSQSFIVRLKA